MTAALLAPAEHAIDLNVKCQSQPNEEKSKEISDDTWPHHELSRLYWAQKDLVNKQDLPLSYKKNNEDRVHYVLTNSSHFVRNLVWD